LLDWQTKRSLRETLPTMVAALKSDPLGFYEENELKPPAWLTKRAAARGKEVARDGE
jgi:hypothetical protein